MQYKLLAIDMDGTLLDSDKHLRDTTVAAINRAMEAGVLFTIATGRSIHGIESVRHRLWPNAPIVAYNGATIFAHEDRQILFDCKLDTDIAKDVYEWGKARGVSFINWSDNKLYIFEKTKYTDYYVAHANIAPILIEDEREVLEQGLTKILWVDEASNIARYQQELQGMLKGRNVTSCTSQPEYLEFLNGASSKGNAVKFVAEHLGILPSEILAIGDEMNDISMLKYVGLGIAMGNALDAVKESADLITLSNDEDGVAHVIDTIVLK